MKQVTARYRVRGLCTGAEGFKQLDCIGAEAVFEVVLDTDTRTLLTGSGPVKASAQLVQFTDPFGDDALAHVRPEFRTWGPIDCRVSAGRLDMVLPFTGVDVKVTAYMMNEGAEIAYGHFECQIRSRLWRLFLRKVAGDFGGKLLIQEFHEGA